MLYLINYKKLFCRSFKKINQIPQTPLNYKCHIRKDLKHENFIGISIHYKLFKWEKNKIKMGRFTPEVIGLMLVELRLDSYTSFPA